MMFSKKSVRRHTYSPFLNKSAGIISSYDPLFRKYAPVARWDWRLMAAQCYQESCFDPKARSWAGACGLMQIMPATAAHLGLPLSDIYNPEPNIAAAAKFISQLMNSFVFLYLPHTTPVHCTYATPWHLHGRTDAIRIFGTTWHHISLDYRHLPATTTLW